MSTDVEICNRALSACNARATITALNENSNEARACSRIYNSTRDELLSQTWWTFARAMVAATLTKSATGAIWDSTQPAPPWAYQYSYPADAIAIRYITGQASAGPTIPIFSTGGYSADFAYSSPSRFIIASDSVSGVQTQVLLTDIPNALLCYTRRITNQDIWSAQFEQAMVYALAGYLALPLTGNLGLSKMMFQMAQEKCTEAQVSDAIEGLTIQDRIPESLRVRGIGDPFVSRIP